MALLCMCKTESAAGKNPIKSFTSECEQEQAGEPGTRTRHATHTNANRRQEGKRTPHSSQPQNHAGPARQLVLPRSQRLRKRKKSETEAVRSIFCISKNPHNTREGTMCKLMSCGQIKCEKRNLPIKCIVQAISSFVGKGVSICVELAINVSNINAFVGLPCASNQ